MIVADREMVESSSDEILADADSKDIAFLVVGDPFGFVRLATVNVLNFLTSILERPHILTSPFVLARLVFQHRQFTMPQSSQGSA